MMHRILVATDGSQSALAALHFLAALPLPEGACAGIVTVLEDLSGPIFVPGGGSDWESDFYDRLRDSERQAADRALGSAESLLLGRALNVSTYRREGDPAHEILAAATEFEADLIVVGSRGRTGLESFLLGSVARNVAAHARQPVLIAREPAHQLLTTVVAVDASAHSRDAIRCARELPLPASNHRVLTHVMRPYDPYVGLIPSDPDAYQVAVEQVRRQRLEAGEELLGAARTELEQHGLSADTEIRAGRPVEEILGLAREREADLVIAGARGHSLIEGLFIGSVCDALMKRCDVSLLVAR